MFFSIFASFLPYTRRTAVATGKPKLKGLQQLRRETVTTLRDVALPDSMRDEKKVAAGSTGERWVGPLPPRTAQALPAVHNFRKNEKTRTPPALPPTCAVTVTHTAVEPTKMLSP